jgi:hypothetical protein
VVASAAEQERMTGTAAQPAVVVAAPGAPLKTVPPLPAPAPAAAAAPLALQAPSAG